MTFQYRPQWNSAHGGPGVSVFNVRLSGAALTTGPQQIADNIHTFFADVAQHMPDDISFTFPAEVAEMNTTTGTLEAIHPVNAPAQVTGGNANSYMGAAGTSVIWHTEAIVAGRRLRGRTFLVPLVAGAFHTDGTLISTTAGLILQSANNLISDMENVGSLAVWSRTHGVLADVAQPSLATLGSVLRSRRD